MKMKKTILILAGLMLAFPLAFGQDNSPKINKKNLVIKEWNSDGKGVAKSLDHITTYSPEGKKVEEIEYDSLGKQKWRKRFEYGADGKVSRELVYNEYNRLVNIKKFEFNEFGRKKVQYTYDAKGRLTGTKYYEYITEDAL